MSEAARTIGVVLVVGGLCVGCGAAPKSASAPGAPAAEEPGARARDEVTGGTRAGEEDKSVEPPADQYAPTPGPQPTRPSGATSAGSQTKVEIGTANDAIGLIEEEERVMLGALDEAKKATGPSSSGSDTPCGRACTALDSMRRSVARLCELTASSDRRCDEAKRRLGKNEELARQARCECPAR